MRTIRLSIIGSILFACICSVNAQGTFENLDFEDANVVTISGQPNAITVANAFPGWTVDYGSVQQSQVTYNDPSLGGTAITLLANGYPSLTGETALDGNYSAFMFAGLYHGEPAAATISQMGQIPTGTESLLFEWSGVGSQPLVFIGSDSLTLFPVRNGNDSGGSAYTVYGANISAWSGQTEQLSFSENSGIGRLDDISFSPNPITTTPEPDAFTLIIVGGALFAGYRRFAPKRNGS